MEKHRKMEKLYEKQFYAIFRKMILHQSILRQKGMQKQFV